MPIWDGCEIVAETSENYRLNNLRLLEAESIHILREVVAEFERPVMLYSVGKDSSVMVHLAQKAFHPGKIPFPLLHVDTTLKFPEMYAFREEFCRTIGADLRIYINRDAVAAGCNPWDLGTIKCCAQLKTQGLLKALREGNYDAVIGGSRREEEKSRAKERVYSFRDANGQWDPRNQRPELWNLYNGRINPDESIRIFPLSNWTELDIWQYIMIENIHVVPIYFAREREVIVRQNQMIPIYPGTRLPPGTVTEKHMCRFRTLGCYPCTGAVPSTATTVEAVIAELMIARNSERVTRIIDHDQDSSMEQKKREGYF